jgi:hypothetical protein
MKGGREDTIESPSCSLERDSVDFCKAISSSSFLFFLRC